MKNHQLKRCARGGEAGWGDDLKGITKDFKRLRTGKHKRTARKFVFGGKKP